MRRAVEMYVRGYQAMASVSDGLIGAFSEPAERSQVSSDAALSSLVNSGLRVVVPHSGGRAPTVEHAIL